MKIPSDLMIEQLEMAQMTLPKGIRNEVRELEHCTMSEVTVEDEDGAAAIGREQGSYITIETAKSYEIGEPAFEEIAAVLRSEVGEGDLVLIMGAGDIVALSRMLSPE